MREQLSQYVSLLFAGARNCEDIKQEILQNTLDRYDDLIAEGKSPEAAYRLAITGIGDINEILNAGSDDVSVKESIPHDTPTNPLLRALGIALYILCPTPLILLSELGLETIGLCVTLVMVAAATVLVILGGKKESAQQEPQKPQSTPQQELRNSIHSAVSTVGIIIYFILSFLTGAWHLTWLVFPLIGAVKGLINAIMDLKEAADYEN